jgi:hypothetical protein
MTFCHLISPAISVVFCRRTGLRKGVNTLNRYTCKGKQMKNGLLGLITGACFLFILSNSAAAFDYKGRIDTRYKLQIGDHATDNDIYQYHFLNLLLSERWRIDWYGQIRKDLDGFADEATTGDEEKTDVAFQDVPDSVNLGHRWIYRIYEAYAEYRADSFGGLIGRHSLYEYEYSQFDGIMLWGTPLNWLKLEGFCGKPSHYANYLDSSQSFWIDGEITGGAGADFLLYDQKLNVYLRYLYLKELTQRTNLINEPEDTYLSGDHVGRVRVDYFHEYWLRAGFGASVLNTDVRDLYVKASGIIDKILLSYYAEYYMQFMDIDQLGDSLTKFSALLTASNPYLRMTVDLSQSFADILGLQGVLDDVVLELIYEHRQPLDSADETQFNPHYDMFNIGTILSFERDWYCQLFFEYIKTTGAKNDIQTLGGEISKKWEKLKLQLGSSFYANQYETNYTQTVVEDKFYAQEYYFKSKWRATESLDVSFKAALEAVAYSSLTSADKINSAVVYAPITTIINDKRYYGSFDLRAGYNF